MSVGTSPCTPCCPTPQVTNIPGTQGNDGSNGINGVNAFTLTITSSFNVPALTDAPLTVPVANSTWMVIGQILIVTGPATFRVTAIPSTTSVTLQFINAPGDVASGTNVPIGSTVSPAGVPGTSNWNYLITAASLALTDAMTIVEVTTDGKTITLPTAVGRTGKLFSIKLTASGATTVATTGGQTIDGITTFVLHQNETIKVASNGSNWVILVRRANHIITTAINYLATSGDDVIELTAATLTVTLPTAVGIAGKVYTIKLTANSTATIQANGAENIDAANTASLSAQYKYKAIVSDGVGWLIIANN